MRFFIACFMIVINLFASEFVFNKEFSKDIKTNILQMSLTVVSNSKSSEKEVLLELSKFSDFISSYSGAITYAGGNFEILPMYSYKNNTNILDGYQGSIYYIINASDNNGIEKFIKDIQTIKKSKNTTYSINQISWIANPNGIEEANEKLREDAIIWTDKYITDLSKKLNKKCKLINIDFSSVNVYNNPLLKSSMDTMRVPDVQKPNYKASIFPTIKIECE